MYSGGFGLLALANSICGYLGYFIFGPVIVACVGMGCLMALYIICAAMLVQEACKPDYYRVA